MIVNIISHQSCRIALLEMRNAEEAKKVIDGLNNTPMDKNHRFHVYRYADVANLLENAEELSLPEKDKYTPLQKAQTTLYGLI